MGSQSDSKVLSLAMPLMDRPFIFHVIEHLVSQDIKDIHMVVCQPFDLVKELVNDGSRWGISITYHHAQMSKDIYKTVQYVDNFSDKDPFLLVNGHNLPVVDIIVSKPDNTNANPLLYTCSHGNKPPSWTGWAWIFKKHLYHFHNSHDMDMLYNALMKEGGQKADSFDCLCANSYHDLYNSHFQMIQKKVLDLKFSGNEVENGIWISRNVKLHPTAKVYSPVFLGENSEISAGCTIGPNAFVGKNCFVGEKTEIADSVVFSETFMGEGLEIKRFLVNKKQLFNHKSGALVPIPEDFILGDFSTFSSYNPLKKFLKRFL